MRVTFRDPFHQKFRLLPWNVDGWQLAMMAIVLVGIVLRVIQFCANRSLWLDEAMLALNIVNHTPFEFLGTLDNVQIAPLGYLLVEKGLVTLLGNHEYSLRLFALLSGCLSLIVMALVANHFVEERMALLAVALFAVGNHAIYFASEVKPYASDMAICLLLTLFAARHVARPVSFRLGTQMGVAGALALWFAYPVPFVLAGIGCAFVYHRVVSRQWQELLPLGWAGMLWVGSFALLYISSVQNAASNTFLLGYWEKAFMPWSLQAPGWLIATVQNWLRNPVGLAGLSVKLAALLFVAGVIHLLMTNVRGFLIVVAPIVFVLLASGAQKYPATGRLLLFLLPNLLLLIAMGMRPIQWLLRRAWLTAPVMLIVAGLLLWHPMISAVADARAPRMGEHIRPLVAYLQTHAQPGDDIYIYYGAVAAFQYYAPMYGFDAGSYVAGIDARDDLATGVKTVDALQGGKRVWILFSHVYQTIDLDEEAVFLDRFDQLGEKVESVNSPGATLYLYDLTSHGASSERAADGKERESATN